MKYFLITVSIVIFCSSMCFAQPAPATVDTVWVPLQDDSLFFILHKTSETDSMLMMDFGYKKAGTGWVATFEHGFLEDAMDSINYSVPVVVYTHTPSDPADVNQDGRVNIGDLAMLIKLLFR